MAKKVFQKFVSAGEPGKHAPVKDEDAASENEEDDEETMGKSEEEDEEGDVEPTILEESEPHIEDKSMDRRKGLERGDLNKTIFIQNLPFDVNSEDIKKHFLTFGKVKSVFLVLHPKSK